ncbi:hypothetical protein CDV36_007961 [Fusarium kuroshium]|uniref:Uncharacterized protein n=1 Tax=Fusarium kuroshium TaxID=2010991 RepID=A0A3M2S560_9HYPO|nr:hypothetical protein CDV36_007961 [Fusarium kuroshium]
MISMGRTPNTGESSDARSHVLPRADGNGKKQHHLSARAKKKDFSGTGNRTLGSAELIPQVMRARNVSHYTIPDMIGCC